MDNMMSGLALAAALDEENDKKGRKAMNEYYVSPILKNLIGKEVIVDCDMLDSESCKVLDVDAEWITLLVHGRKGDSTYIERIDSINEIKVV